jgi:hypothetical protein
MNWMYLYGPRSVQPKLNYCRRIMAMEDPPLKDLLIVMPQPGDQLVEIAKIGQRRIVNRERRVRGGEVVSKFGEITDPKHLRLVQLLLESDKPTHPFAELWAPGRGVVLAYLVREQKPVYDTKPKPLLGSTDPERGLIFAFAMYLPKAAVGTDNV